MDKNKALEILGLNKNATQDDITKRVGILLKKFKNIEKDEKGNTLADIESAYRCLTGINYEDKEAEKKKEYRKTHPNPFFKLLRVDEEKARNFFYYYKWHMIIAIIVIGVVVSTVVSIVNRVEPDLKVVVAGDIYVEKVEAMEERLEKEIDGVTEALVQNIFLSEKNDPHSQAMMLPKFTIEISEAGNDIIILDEEKYMELAVQGLFKPLDDILDELNVKDIKGTAHEDLKVAINIDDGSTYKPMVYGLDVTQSAFLNENGVIGERLIVTLAYKGTHSENAKAFIKKILEKK